MATAVNLIPYKANPLCSTPLTPAKKESALGLHIPIAGSKAIEKLLNSTSWYRKDMVPETVYTPYLLIERDSVSAV